MGLGREGLYSGRLKLELCARLSGDWAALADYFEIPESTRRRFERGREPHEVWEWLSRQGRLGELRAGLDFIGRADLVGLLGPDPVNRPADAGPVGSGPADDRLPEIDEIGAPTVGIITALPHESAAIRAVLGDPGEIPVPGKGAGRRYWMAEVSSAKGGRHRVVIAQAGMGTNLAAVRATLLLAHFPVEAIIMCGIAGGIPHPAKPGDHVRLGDIVVSNVKGVVQYDFVKRSIGGEEREVIEEVRSSSHRPDPWLTEAVDLLESDRHLGRHLWEAVLSDGLGSLGWTRPEESTDKLASAADPSLLVAHPQDAERRPGHPRVFLGPIASANTLLKDPVRRDALRDRFGAKAVEMEASGIVDATWTRGVGYLVVRGICDYCDSNKGDAWQRYAALAAAAYVRALLESMPGSAAASPR
jgi:nucleoside phosphorylase